MREFVSKVQSMMKALKLSQSGSTLRISASWKIQDIEELIKQAGAMFGSGPSMGGPPPGIPAGPGGP